MPRRRGPARTNSLIEELKIFDREANRIRSCPIFRPWALETAGYTLRIREPNWFEHRLFKGPDTDINLHMFSEGTSEIKRMLRFRDWLRTNDTDRENYARAKRDLAQHVWRNVQNYADK